MLCANGLPASYYIFKNKPGEVIEILLLQCWFFCRNRRAILGIDTMTAFSLIGLTRGQMATKYLCRAHQGDIRPKLRPRAPLQFSPPMAA